MKLIRGYEQGIGTSNSPHGKPNEGRPCHKTSSYSPRAPICSSIRTIRSTGGCGGVAALEEARRLDRPILLSIGYAACHWCHVMAHGSFEDADVAEVMNALFVNIKVDREERPDLDQVYMSALSSAGSAWRLAAHHVLDAGRRTLLGRHLLPQGGATDVRASSRSCARWPISIEPSPRRWRRTPRRYAAPSSRRGPHYRRERSRRQCSTSTRRGSVPASIACMAD